jgi:hypothetical protein
MQRPVQVPVPGGLLVAALGQPAGGVPANRAGQPVARTGHHIDQRLVGQLGQGAEGVVATPLDSGQIHRTGEHGQPAQ